MRTTNAVCAALLALSAACSAAERGSTDSAAAGAQPGDEQMTCEQIFAQGMAESQREQQERNQKIAERKKENAATATLMTGAMMAGGLGGSGQAANAAAQAQADRTMSELGTPPQTNPGLDHWKQLWAQKHCVKK